MSGLTYVVHVAGHLSGVLPKREQHCTRCEALLFDGSGANADSGIPKTVPWCEGDRVGQRADGVFGQLFAVSGPLGNDEIECGGMVDAAVQLNS